MKLGDFNGDGKLDYMWMPNNGDGRWLIAYGTSSGFTLPDPNTPALPATTTVGGYSTQYFAQRSLKELISPSPVWSYMQLGDFNGDGKLDYMWIPGNGDGRWLMASTNTPSSSPDCLLGLRTA
jgi:hypothetical protein